MTHDEYLKWLDEEIGKRERVRPEWISSYGDIQRRAEIFVLNKVKEKFLTLTPPPTTLS